MWQRGCWQHVLPLHEPQLLALRARQVGPYIVSRLRELQQKHDIIGDVRGKGLMLGLELVRDRKTKVRRCQSNALRNGV